MRTILKTIIMSCSLLFVSGCAVPLPALILWGGLGSYLVASEGLEKAENEKERKLAEKREKEKKQVARLREEARRKEEAERFEQARLREEKAIKKEVVVFLADVEDRLKRANWDRKALPELLEKTSYFNRRFLPLEIRQRLNLAAGLYAYLTGDKQQAEANFRKAKELGVRNPRMIVSEVWTPGSIEAFNAS